MNGFLLLPQSASNLADEVDTLFYSLLALTGFVALAITVLLIFFVVKYRAGSNADRTRADPEVLRKRNRRIEYAWIFTPLVLFLAIFVWSAKVYSDLYLPPPDAMQISVVAKQWMWKLQQPTGQREINELHVPVGRPVQLLMTSQDVIHSFFVPAFRVKHDVLPGRYTSIWFTATRPGIYQLFCAEFCGTDHSRMTGRVIALQPAEYEQWLRLGGGLDLAAQGAARFREYGCSGCHGANASVHAPKLEGLYGKPVQLQGGASVIADERYIHDSVLLPKSQVVAGFEPIMPSFAGQISEDDLLQIIAYIKSIAADDRRTP